MVAEIEAVARANLQQLEREGKEIFVPMISAEDEPGFPGGNGVGGSGQGLGLRPFHIQLDQIRARSGKKVVHRIYRHRDAFLPQKGIPARSEERRVGKECL